MLIAAIARVGAKNALKHFSRVFGLALLMSSVVPFPACASFEMRRGINVAGPLVNLRAPNAIGNNIEFLGEDGYLNWYTGEELQHMGYDFVRLVVNPAIFLRSDNEALRHQLSQLNTSIEHYTSAGLKVVVDFHFWSPPDKMWTTDFIVPGLGSPAFNAYAALIKKLSLDLKQYSPDQVALELMNEPPTGGCRTNGWIAEQRALVREARSVAQRLPLVVTGCGGQLGGLIALTKGDLNFADANLIYTFHFYEPFLFTHQRGYVDYLYIGGVPYPASAGNMASTMLQTNENIDQSSLSVSDRTTAKSKAAKQITQYFAIAPDKSFVERRLDSIVAWAKENGIASHQLLLGEYAAINWAKTDTPKMLQARKQWDQDVQSAASDRGIASAYWLLPNPKGEIYR